ncbi:mitochondrial ATP-independent inner membrane protease subunit 1a-like [Bidens hawaiensis]|uniref:mitochondrial ATP-independent inner membrane protease subunit 1a-like n=1 Tax=Bidens hawaiensis TaxID=980011 RepID=UPI00404AEED9
MSLFQQWAFLVKEALDKSFLLAKFFCAVHVTNTYLGSTAVVKTKNQTLPLILSLCRNPTISYLQVFGPSMLPTFSLTNELVLLERISTRNGKAGTGDVVVLQSPENPRKFVTKRITGMEGDKITYIVDPKNNDKTETIIVPKGHVWVQGDNIYNSYDSRNFGPVPYGLLKGKIFWKIWPTSAFGSVAKRPETVDPALKDLEQANQS